MSITKLIPLLSSIILPTSIASQSIQVNSHRQERFKIAESTLPKDFSIASNNEIKTVTANGFGTSIEAAAQNAAENALTQVVGSFIDSETLINKQKEIRDGVVSRTKSVKKDIKDYSQ